jgi:tRNA nucleotidyltransferase/poly(A) polymerase
VISRTFRILLHHRAVQALVAASGETECHLVGGVLRDRALGLPSHDVDAVVAGRGREIAGRLAAALPARLVLLGGKEFASYRLVGRDLTFDLWDRAGTSLHEDLARRDFTVDSFALDPRAGAVVDPFGGLADLRRRLLRATTAQSFTGDPLRVLRLPRLLLRLPGFAADPQTLLLARRSSPQLAAVAAERVRDELSFLFAHPEAHRGLALLVALDVYPGLWLGRPGEPGGAGGALAELESLPERIRELRQLDAGAADAVDAPAARLAATFAHLPAAPRRGPLDFVALVRGAGYLTRAAAADVALLLSFAELPRDEVSRRRFLHRAGRLWATAACSLGARAPDPDRWRAALRPLVELARREGAAIREPPRLLSGEEVQTLLGIPPGPEVGKALAALRLAQVDGTVRTRQEAVEILKAERFARGPHSPDPSLPEGERGKRRQETS